MAELTISGETEVVELDLLEPLAGGLARHRDHVVPRLLAERVEPGETLVVHPGAASPDVGERPLGPMAGEHVVGNDPRDGVDAPSLQLLDEHVQIPDPDGDERPRRPRR